MSGVEQGHREGGGQKLWRTSCLSLYQRGLENPSATPLPCLGLSFPVMTIGTPLLQHSLEGRSQLSVQNSLAVGAAMQQGSGGSKFPILVAVQAEAWLGWSSRTSSRKL